MSITSYFILSTEDAPDDGRKLLSYSGTVKNGEVFLTLKVKLSGFDIAHALTSLDEIQRANNAKPATPEAPPAAKKKAIGQSRVLALPAPARGL